MVENFEFACSISKPARVGVVMTSRVTVGRSYKSEEEPFELPLADREVWRVDVSRYVPFLRIEFLGMIRLPGSAPGRDLSLCIEGPFSLTSGDTITSVVPQEGPDPAYLRLVKKRVNRATAAMNGSLRVEFADGDVLSVPPADLEPWQLECDGEGAVVVSVAGGGLVVWDFDPAGEGHS